MVEEAMSVRPLLQPALLFAACLGLAGAAAAEASDAKLPLELPEVSGAPLDLSHLGSTSHSIVPPDAEEAREGWGLQESELRLVPAGQATAVGDLRGGPGFSGPSPNMMRNWSFAHAWSFPSLTTRVSAEHFTLHGVRGEGGEAVQVQRVRANFFLVEAVVHYLHAVEGQRAAETDLELDLRIPFVLEKNRQFALLQGVTFPIDDREKGASTTSVRAQAILGLATGALGFQARAGYVEGSRRNGLLRMDERLHQPAILYGALLSYRLVPALQLRVETSGEIDLEGGEGWGRMSLLPGAVLFPFGDPRVSIGATLLLEDSTRGVLSALRSRSLRPTSAWGGMLQLGLALY